MNDQQSDEFVKAVKDLGFGRSDTSGPGAIESIAMALSGEHLRNPVGKEIAETGSEIAEQIGRVADALNRIADAMERQ